MSTEVNGSDNKRSVFLMKVVVGSISAASMGTALPTLAQAAPGPVVNQVFGYNSFSPAEAAFVENMVNAMCPADSYTPNGGGCGLAIYMDRQFSGAFGQGAKRYLRDPFASGLPQQGPQTSLTPEQQFKADVAVTNEMCTQRKGKAFDQIAPADADGFLHELAGGKLSHPEVDLAGWFNELVYPLFTQACFADPIYGGNVDKVFWKMIGYPGLPATNEVNMVKYRGKPYLGAKTPKSIADFS